MILKKSGREHLAKHRRNGQLGECSDEAFEDILVQCKQTASLDKAIVMFEERKVVRNVNEEDQEKAVIVEEEAIVVDATHDPEDDLPITMLHKVVSPSERAHGSRKETEDGKRKVGQN